MSIWAEKKVAQSRFDICKQCEHLFKPTNTCTRCGCFMKIKVKVGSMGCPVGKW